MISALTGLPGAGKTYQAVVNVILPALRSGRSVWTNVPVITERVDKDALPGQLHVFTSDAVASDLSFFDRLPVGVVLVLDEVWRLWPAGLRALDVNQSHRSFLAEHRHKVDSSGNSTEIVLVTQDLSQVSAFVRQLVERTTIATKLSAVGASKRFRTDVYQGAITGRRGPKSVLITQAVRKYDPKFFPYFRSHTQAVTGAVGKEEKVDKRGVLWKSPMFIIGCLFVVLAVVFGFQRVHSFFSGHQIQHSRIAGAEVAGTPAKLSPVPMQKVSLPPSEPQYSQIWRLGGVISGVKSALGGGYALIESADGVIRHIPLYLCHLMPGDLDWSCKVDGQVVTSWSGVQPQGAEQPTPAFPPCSTFPDSARSHGVVPGAFGMQPYCSQNEVAVGVSSASPIESPSARAPSSSTHQ